MNRIGQRHHIGVGTGTYPHNYPRTSGYYGPSKHHGNECCCFIF